MKSKELVKLIQQADPSGEIEVAVGNHDIHFVELQPAYWDGRLQLLVRDESRKPYYDIVGAKVVSSGYKLTIHTLGVEDVIMNNSDAPIDLSDLETNMPTAYAEWKKKVDDWRKETKDIEAEIEAQMKARKS